MSKKTWYIQCHFESPTENGKKVGIAWLPAKFAQIGRVIYFGKKTNTPDRLWTIVAASGYISEDYLRERERDYLTQRQASDI
jgi:hypothetical protein